MNKWYVEGKIDDAKEDLKKTAEELKEQYAKDAERVSQSRCVAMIYHESGQTMFSAVGCYMCTDSCCVRVFVVNVGDVCTL